MKIKKGYKLLDMDMTSPYVIALGVAYVENEWVGPQPECGPLCVFNTLENLQAFIYAMEDPFMIWECEYTPSKSKSVWKSLGVKFHQVNLLSHLPVGTMLASRVKLTRRIK